jgi:hypothetical protein
VVLDTPPRRRAELRRAPAASGVLRLKTNRPDNRQSVSRRLRVPYAGCIVAEWEPLVKSFSDLQYRGFPLYEPGESVRPVESRTAAAPAGGRLLRNFGDHPRKSVAHEATFGTFT